MAAGLRSICIVLLSLGISLSSSAQSYTTIRYAVAEGLPSNEVYEVFQDKNGFLWFATDNGVVKYDGYEMVRLGVDEGLTDPVVFGFVEDYKGRIWFRTFSGRISYYHNGKVHDYRYNDKLVESLNASIISSIWIDSLDQFWFSTFRLEGFYGKVDSLGNMTKYKPVGSMYYKQIGEGKLYGYPQVVRDSWQIDEKVFPIKEMGICEVFNINALHWKGKLYLSACDHIFRYDGNELVIVYRSRVPIISLSTDAEENLWVGYVSHGVEKFSTDEFKKGDSPKFLEKFSVTKVFQDNQKGLWFSTLEQGLFHVPNIGIKNYVLPSDEKIRFVGSSDNNIYIGSNTGSIYESSADGTINQLAKLRPPLKGLYVDGDKHVWISSATRTDRIGPSAKKTAESFPYNLTNATEDENGNVYGVSGGAMLVVIDKERKNFLVKRLPFMCRSVFVQDTSLFIGTRNGMYVSDLSASNPKEIKTLSDFKINEILKLNDSTLLLTTIGRGFLIFDVRTYSFTNYSTKNKFVANNIYAAITEGRNLWLGTENGLVRLNKNSVLRNALDFEVFTHHNGLIDTQVTFLAFANDRIWVFAENGYSLVNTEISHTRKTPAFYLKNIKVNNHEISSRERLQDLAYDQNNISISFGFISLDKQKIFIRHRLNPSEQWNYSLAKNLQFYSLAPGAYSIETEYSLDNGIWVSAFLANVAISPPLWRKWYFLTAVTISIFLLAFLFVRREMRVYRRHQLKLIQSEIQTIERERTRIAKDLHDSVGTDFSAIKMMVSQLLRKHQEPVADEIESQFQSSIQEIKSIIYGLAPPGLERYGLMTGLKNYAEKIDGKVPARITVSTFGEEVKDQELSMSVFRIIQELISNSLKHADAKTITIHINGFKDLLNIVYEDDGKGFTWNDSQRGAGLYNVESRVQSVKGNLKFESNQYGVSYTIDIPIRPVQLKM
jgi:signal transduction histidine kinase